MKKMLIAIILLLCASTASFAQSEDNPPVAMSMPAAGRYKNEFGIDATGFIKQFFNFSQQSSSYVPEYYFTYRRHFKPGNLRFAVGAGFANQDIPAAFTGDNNTYHSYNYNIDFRIGWEYISELSKRWQVFYGLDLRPSFVHDKNDAPYFNGGYANGHEAKSTTIGLAPVLGFRYRITTRLSLMTEATFSINYQSGSSRRYYIPVTNQYPTLPDEATPKVNRTFSSFSQPISLIIAFDI